MSGTSRQVCESRSCHRGSAWEWDETSQQYYLHLFLKEQPDLNWENPTVRNEVYDLMHWWLKRGADGFRMDVVSSYQLARLGDIANAARKINFISKAPGLPDAPITQPGRDFQPFDNLSINRPQVHEWLKEMNKEVLSVSATCLTGRVGLIYVSASDGRSEIRLLRGRRDSRPRTCHALRSLLGPQQQGAADGLPLPPVCSISDLSME